MNGFSEEVVEQCDKCTFRAMHHMWRSGVTTTLCCKHYVADGHPPADWHPDCMKAALSALPPQPDSPVGAGDVEALVSLVTNNVVDLAAKTYADNNKGSCDIYAMRKALVIAVAAMPRAAQGDADYKALYEQEKAWRSSDNASLTKEIQDLQAELNLPHPINAPKYGDVQMEEALRAIVNALARLCYLRDHKKQYGEDVYYRSSKTQAWKSAEAALTHLSTLEAAVGGKGE